MDGSSGYIPRPGDIIYFDWHNGGIIYDHVGIVLSVSNGRVHTIEGNANNSVKVDGGYSNGYALGSNVILGYGIPNYIDDSDEPSFSDFHVGELWEGGFTVMAKVTDPSGISQVKYAIWTENGEQDDIKWYQGHCTDNNDYYWSRINFSDHNGEKGKYIIHMYAYDNAGNLTNPGITYIFGVDPQLSNTYWGETTNTTIRPVAVISNPEAVSHVRFAVWTTSDQSDIKWFDANYNDAGEYFCLHQHSMTKF